MSKKKDHFAGMKRVMVKLSEAYGDPSIEVEAFVSSPRNKLAITAARYSKGYNVTHRKSGRTIGHQGVTAAVAIERRRKLAPLGKWDAIYKALYK